MTFDIIITELYSVLVGVDGLWNKGKKEWNEEEREKRMESGGK